MCLAIVILIVQLSTLIAAVEGAFGVEGGAFGVHEQQAPPEDAFDFPPMLDSDDIAYFFSTYDLDGLHWALTNVFARSSRMMIDDGGITRLNPLPDQIVARGGGSHYSSEYKLKLDLEQAQYLIENVLTQDAHPQMYDFYAKKVIPTFTTMLERIPALEQLHRTEGLYAFRQEDYNLGIHQIYNKALWVPDPNYDVNESLLNPDLDVQKIQKEWKVGDHPGIIVVDDILSAQTLTTIRNLLQESTVWYQTKMPKKFGGYAGAYIDDGLHAKILLALSIELHSALPEIMKDHPLKYMWAYKYDSNFTGINMHADQAAVNVNLWITPEQANLDKDSGGLVVFTAKPPKDWDFSAFNTDTERVTEKLLRPTNFANVTVPHRENRAVIFDSALFHHTDHFKFKQGYTNRRINLTLLYGDMKFGSDPTCPEGKKE